MYLSLYAYTLHTHTHTNTVHTTYSANTQIPHTTHTTNTHILHSVHITLITHTAFMLCATHNQTPHYTQIHVIFISREEG